MKKSIHLALSSLIAVLAPPTMILTYSHPVGAAEFSDQIDSIGDYLTDIPGQEPLREDDYLIDHYPLLLPDGPIYLIDHYPLLLPDGPIYSDPIYEYFPDENGTVDRTLCITCRDIFSDPVPLSTSIPEPSNLLGYIILGGVILGGAIKSKGK